MKIKLSKLLYIIFMIVFIFSIPVILLRLYPNPNTVIHSNIRFPEPIDYQNNYVKFYDI